MKYLQYAVMAGKHWNEKYIHARARRAENMTLTCQVSRAVRRLREHGSTTWGWEINKEKEERQQYFCLFGLGLEVENADQMSLLPVEPACSSAELHTAVKACVSPPRDVLIQRYIFTLLLRELFLMCSFTFTGLQRTDGPRRPELQLFAPSAGRTGPRDLLVDYVST